MLQQWLIQAAIAFALRQLAKWQGAIDWDKVKADLAVRLRDLVPGKMFDEMAIKLLNSVVDLLASVLSDQAEISKVVQLLVAGKVAEAMEVIKQLIISKFKAPGALSDQMVEDVLASL